MSSINNVPIMLDGSPVVCAHCRDPIFKNEKFVTGRILKPLGSNLDPGTKQAYISYYHEEKPECFIASCETRQ